MDYTTLAQICVELRQVRITLLIKNICIRNIKEICGRANVYDILNSLERWLISIVNSNIDRCDVVFENDNDNDFVQNDNQIRKTQSLKYSIYRDIPYNHPINTQLCREFMNKCPLLTQNQAYILCKTLIAKISRMISKPLHVFNESVYYDTKNETINYGHLAKVFIGNVSNIKKLIHTNGLIYSLIMALRYIALITGGQQWSLPYKHYEHLYNLFDEFREGFASALNAKSLYFKNSKFCSIFPELESKIGSQGSFFSVPLHDQNNTAENQVWVINPPFIESIISAMASKVIKSLDESARDNHGLATYIMLPDWKDMKALNILLQSKYLVQSLKLERGSMFFELLNGSPYYIVTNYIYLVLYSLNGKNNTFTSKLTDGLKQITQIQSNIESRAEQHMIFQIQLANTV